MDGVNLNKMSAGVGYSDEQLEMLCLPRSRFECGIAPWAAWESENSSFGKTFREWTNYPKLFPLYISSDHGVHWESRCWPNEINSRYSTFFTWNKKKNDLMRRIHNKKSYHVPHPWVSYRRKHFSTLPINRLGTLVFFPHSNTSTTPVYENLDEYIADLKSLPEKYQPVVMCLSFHDIDKKIHKKLRSYDIPLVTNGTTNSKNFIDRFYSLLYQFKYASSSNVGSHTFYILEAGIPFFLYGPYPKYHIKGSVAVKDGEQDLRDYGDEEDLREFSKFKQLLSSPEDKVTAEQHALMSKYLGLDSEITRLKASLILWRELFLHSSEVVTVYAKLAFRLMKKIKLLKLSRTK